MTNKKELEQMNVVIVGHVDHGKSSVIGRLLVDTKTLPKSKIEQIKAFCKVNSRPFEYAFLLDALKDEQTQGITIDSARCFFKTNSRHYIIIDAPGHIEFLKNMISGAARAEAALLVIDAKEGVQENSKRHGHMLSLLGIEQVIVLVNKMDLVDYNSSVFESIQSEYTQFLSKVDIKPIKFIPISALEGDNISTLSQKTSFYKGTTVLDSIDEFSKESKKEQLPFRMPLQDIYRFTESNDDRRIFTGTIDNGTIHNGDSVTFLPSQKQSEIKSIEYFTNPDFNESPLKVAKAGQALGFTLKSQIYIRPGEIMTKTVEKSLPSIGTKVKVSLFWIGKKSMEIGSQYKIKLASNHAIATLESIESVLDSSTLDQASKKNQVDRNDVSQVTLKFNKPLSFDLESQYENTNRFVLISDYEIAGGGKIIENIQDSSTISRSWNSIYHSRENNSNLRLKHYKHYPQCVFITGNNFKSLDTFSNQLESKLLEQQFKTYLVGIQDIDSLKPQTQDLKQRLHINEIQEKSLEDLNLMAVTAYKMGLIFIGLLPEVDSIFMQEMKEQLSKNGVFRQPIFISSQNNSVDNALNIILDTKLFI